MPRGKCNPDDTCSSPGDTCIDGTCISCGVAGHVCCDQKADTGCTQSSCVTGLDDFAMCENCGGVGQACCTGTNDPCQSGTTCEIATHTCKVDPNQGQGATHKVWLETQQHCAAVAATFFTVSSTQTIAGQAQALLAAANAGLPAAQQFILGPVDVAPTAYHRCRYVNYNSIDHLDVLAYSHIEEATCEASYGPTSALWAWQGPQGDCPAPWATNMYPPNP
jgi:hypothetical protein